MEISEREIATPVLLCDESGELNPEAIGWSRHPIHTCNLRGRPLRKKKWDYWCITGKDFLFSTTIAHIGYLSLGAVYFLEYKTRRSAESVPVHLFPAQPDMPETVGGRIAFHHRRLSLSYEMKDNTLYMTAEAASLAGKPFHADLQIGRDPRRENLNVVIPWDARTFQFTSKQQCLPAQGTLTWGDETFLFHPDTSFACLDYGRGIWPYRTSWNWAAFSGRSGEDTVGINMGAKWTDNTGMNENGMLVNGRLHKIHGDILFEYDPRDFMRPWRMHSGDDDSVRLEFTPFHEKVSRTNLALIRSQVHQMFGYFTGTLRADGRTIPINHIMGWAEEHYARW